MRKFVGCVGGGLLLWAVLVQPAAGQTAPTGSDATETVGSRFGLRYITEGSGYDPFASFETFFPLFQTAGNHLTFLEGRLLLSSKSALGGNAVLGYRSYNASRNRILGGYLAYDMRDTGESIFNQIGAGLESLGDDWDLRVNAYIPVGNTRNQISESFGAAFFQQNSLRLERVRQYEAAMAGGDVEAGGRLLTLGDGDLRGYGGVYYYWAEGSDSVVGVKARLIARPTDYLGLSVLQRKSEKQKPTGRKPERDWKKRGQS